MHITALKAFADNYIWMIRSENACVCVDPGDAAPVLDFLEQNRLKPAQIWITHHHDDHRGGVGALQRAFADAPCYGNGDIAEASVRADEGVHIAFGGGRATVWATPGHTAGHVSYLFEHEGRLHVFCGDTLFSAGCGRVFTGTVEALFDSFQRFNRLPETALFYPAHEYTAANLRFAAHIEPDNADIQTALAAAHAHTPTLPVTLAHERKVNPFLRTALPHVRARAQALIGQTLDTEAQVFAALRELKNRF